MRAHRAAALVAGEAARAHARARAPPHVVGGWRHRLVVPAGRAHPHVGTLAPLGGGVPVVPVVPAVPAVPAFPASPRWLHRGFAGSAVPPPSDPAPPSPADQPPARSVPASPAPWSFADVATWPNGLSVARGVAGPALAYAVLHDADPAFVLAGVLAAAVSDWLDGHLARRWNQRSVAGTYLDPVGDKIFVASLAIALAVRGDVPAWLAACLVGRDAALVVAALYQRARALEWRWNTWAEFAGVAFDDDDDDDDDDARRDRRARARLPPLEPQMMGKISTAGQFALFGGALAHQAAGWPTAEMMETVHAAVGATTVASAGGYLFLSSDVFARAARRTRSDGDGDGDGFTGTGTKTGTKTGRDRSSSVASAYSGARR